MTLGYAVVAILAAAVAVFALQNSAPTRVRLLFWVVDGVPLAAVILFSLAVGIVVVGLPLWIQRWQLRTRARALEARLGAVEQALAERERSAGSPPTRQ
ncbi:MAG: LapA family protein [Candidatus Rokubacteria bacterium]|nr:LapA family protein [Candidatus Rokubacteria bacterium]